MSQFQRLVFDTTALGAQRDPGIRARIWAEQFESVVTAMDMGFSSDDARVIGTHDFVVNDTLAIGEMFSSSFVGARTSRHISRDNDDSVYVNFNIGRTEQIGRQLGREVVVRPGQAALLIMEASADAIAPVEGHCLSLKLPSAQFAQWGLSAPDLACRALDTDGADYRVLVGYIRLLIAEGAGLDAGAAGAASRHLIDLTARWLGVAADDRVTQGEEAPYQARLALIRHIIGRHACDPAINLERIARIAGLPARTLQHMLARNGERFSLMLMTARLNRARILLRDPGCADQPIASIAFRCGFLDVSSFYRAFRTAYGVTPKALREQQGASPAP